MKAIAITGQGGIDTIQYLEVERPRLGPREVLIETRAAALNRLGYFRPRQPRRAEAGGSPCRRGRCGRGGG